MNIKENLGNELKEIDESLEKIKSDKANAFNLLEGINSQKLEIENMIQEIQFREEKLREKETSLKKVLTYISAYESQGE